MIRRKVSSGLLRASKSTSAGSSASNAVSATSAAVGASPMQQQSANLASAVLLSSQRSWKGETVATLKGELKKRGLSQTGNKSILVARLTSAETSQHLPPSPSVPSSYRKISTTSPASAGSGSGKKAIPSNSDDTATLSDTKEMTTGPEISSKTAEAESFEEPTKEELNVAPGLPESGKVAPSSGEKLSIKMPSSGEESQVEQVIPLEPDNFRAKVDSKPEAQQEGKDDVPGPKVQTVAAAATHLSGGPVSAVHEAADTLSDKASEASDKIKEAADNLPSFEGAGKSLASAVNSLTGISKSAGEFTRSFIPEIGLPKPPKGKGGGEYKAPEKGLDDGEKRGLWVLGGIVGLGLMLGGGSKDKKGGGHLMHDVKALADKAKGGKGGKAVKGDAEWEKPSGAGVVGHGARKE